MNISIKFNWFVYKKKPKHTQNNNNKKQQPVTWYFLKRENTKLSFMTEDILNFRPLVLALLSNNSVSLITINRYFGLRNKSPKDNS
jgi:hypothetical protein